MPGWELCTPLPGLLPSLMGPACAPALWSDGWGEFPGRRSLGSWFQPHVLWLLASPLMVSVFSLVPISVRQDVTFS